MEQQLFGALFLSVLTFWILRFVYRRHENLKPVEHVSTEQIEAQLEAEEMGETE